MMQTTLNTKKNTVAVNEHALTYNKVATQMVYITIAHSCKTFSLKTFHLY